MWLSVVGVDDITTNARANYYKTAATTPDVTNNSNYSKLNKVQRTTVTKPTTPTTTATTAN